MKERKSSLITNLIKINPFHHELKKIDKKVSHFESSASEPGGVAQIIFKIIICWLIDLLAILCYISQN